MAGTHREPTSNSTQPARVSTAAAPSPFHTSSTSQKPASHDPLTTPANSDALKAGLTTPATKAALLASKVELTGLAAMKENQKHEEELRQQESSMTSQNTAKNIFATPAEPVSRPSDAPPQSAASAPVTPAAPAALAAPAAPGSRPEDSAMSLPAQDMPPVVAEPMEIDEADKGRVVTSSPERTGPGSAGSAESAHRSGLKKRPVSPTSSKHDERSNKSFTYPPPPDHELTPVNRNNSLPNAGTKSPSVKKHRCPHCDTEFTRHHNLKSHLLTHSHEKPYPCKQCNQRFRRLHDLKRHLKLHTGERPHECSICGRKFARGDALARHNKGPGGCAGRRESGAGDEDFSELRADDDIDETYPAGEEYEGAENDKDSDPQQRRRSEPHKQHRRSSARAGSTSSDFRHPSTYPSVAMPSAASRSGDMPPPGSSTTSQPHEPSSQHLAPHSNGAPSFSSVHYNGPSSSMYSQSGMTESPKPLSPGNSDLHRRNSDLRPRSPSLATKLQQQHLPRSGTGNGTPPINLPPPVSSHQPLPSISGFDSRFTNSSGTRPPAITTQLAPVSSGPPSASSPRQSSGGSAREVYSSAPAASQSGWQDENRMKEYLRGVEMRLAEEMTARAAERNERDKIIRSLQEDLQALRNQVAHLQGSQDSSQQHRRSH